MNALLGQVKQLWIISDTSASITRTTGLVSCAGNTTCLTLWVIETKISTCATLVVKIAWLTGYVVRIMWVQLRVIRNSVHPVVHTTQSASVHATEYVFPTNGKMRAFIVR